MIYGFVRGQDFNLKYPPTATGTNEYLQAKFTFSEDWAGTTKCVHFVQGEKDYGIILNEQDEITREDRLNLTEGDWCVCVVGKEKNGDTRITTVSQKYHVEPTCTADPFPVEPPSIGEQILNAANKAQEIAQSVRDDADAGKFKGEQGPAGKGIIPGGKRGQTLTKKSDADYDMEWKDSSESPSWENIQNKPFDSVNPGDFNVTEGQLEAKDIPQTKVIGLVNDLDKIKKSVPTKTSELTNDSDFTTNEKLNKKLDLAGGKMQGKIDMSSFGISNLPKAIANGEPVTFEQLNDAIAGIGTVFNLKGSKPNFEALPKDGNKIGDVWFVEDESVGYIWIEKSGVPQWEKFGPQIDLSGYLTKDGLLNTTGSETNNTMSQDAITKELGKKQDVGDYATKTEVVNATKDKATKTELNDGLAEKQDKGDYALKSDIPKALPNPFPLTFTGASAGTYDGSEAVTVNIPQGGGGSGPDLSMVIDIKEDVQTYDIPLPDIGDFFYYQYALTMPTAPSKLDLHADFYFKREGDIHPRKMSVGIASAASTTGVIYTTLNASTFTSNPYIMSIRMDGSNYLSVKGYGAFTSYSSDGALRISLRNSNGDIPKGTNIRIWGWK